MGKTEIIKYDSHEAAQQVSITGWVSRDGRFFGNNEHAARHAGCTHVACSTDGCIEYAKRPYIYCDSCRRKQDIERYNTYEFREWDETVPVYSRTADEYFYDSEDIESYLEDQRESDPAFSPDDLMLVICQPVYPQQIACLIATKVRWARTAIRISLLQMR